MSESLESAVIGHGAILSAFDRLAAADRLAHAYLLTGPAGVGKATVATWLAARLLCRASRRQTSDVRRQQVPCGTCDACTAVARGSHPDVFRLSDADALAVDRVREWTASLAQSALFAGWKIGILEGAERMNEASANACLKSIEEPTPKTVIILTAVNRRAVLPTIASRCAVIACNRLPSAGLVAALVGRGIPQVEAESLAALVDGCPGRALAFVAEPSQRTAWEQRLALAREMVSDSYSERCRRVESFVRSLPDERSDAAVQLMGLMREFCALARGAAPEQRAQSQWIDWQLLLSRAPQNLAANVTPRLLLETIALTYPV